jgi:hypothetical protein
VTVVQREKSPVAKSSAKIATGPLRTVIGADVPLIGLVAGRVDRLQCTCACSPGARPVSTKVVEDVVPT